MTGKGPGAGGPSDWDVPPWMLPGNSRLDAEPHRGTLLRWLANAAFLAALAALYPCGCPLIACLVTPDNSLLLGPAIGLALLAILGGLTVRGLSAHDLRGMTTGIINRDGEWETRFARSRALVSLAVALGAVLLWGGLGLFCWLYGRSP
jgi:hypothetical protein